MRLKTGRPARDRCLVPLNDSVGANICWKFPCPVLYVHAFNMYVNKPIPWTCTHALIVGTTRERRQHPLRHLIWENAIYSVLGGCTCVSWASCFDLRLGHLCVVVWKWVYLLALDFLPLVSPFIHLHNHHHMHRSLISLGDQTYTQHSLGFRPCWWTYGRYMIHSHVSPGFIWLPGPGAGQYRPWKFIWT